MLRYHSSAIHAVFLRQLASDFGDVMNIEALAILRWTRLPHRQAFGSAGLGFPEAVIVAGLKDRLWFRMWSEAGFSYRREHSCAHERGLELWKQVIL
jgi:uncharacterized protein YjlB